MRVVDCGDVLRRNVPVELNLQGSRLSICEIEDGGFSADCTVMIGDFLRAPGRDKFRQRLPGQKRARKIDDVGVAKQVVEEWPDRIERIGAPELKCHDANILLRHHAPSRGWRST